jgi:hypothetical protein
MGVQAIDERMVASERANANFLAFIYEGGDRPHSSWSVDSYLLTGTSLASALGWLSEHLPIDSCWALGVVVSPVDRPTPESEVDVRWIVGADVLNTQPRDWSAGGAPRGRRDAPPAASRGFPLRLAGPESGARTGPSRTAYTC